MTKFILVGGFVRKAPDEGKAFCQELVNGFQEPVKILDCMFASFSAGWDQKFEEDKKLFKYALPNKKVELQLANIDSFIKQVQWADAIFLRGGSPEELIKVLEEKKEWREYIDGKTVAGTSAGADALSKYYFGLRSLKVRQGLGILSIKTIPHFKSDYNGWEFDWDKAYTQLETHEEKLPLLALREGEFKVFLE